MHHTLSLIYGMGFIPLFSAANSAIQLRQCREAREGGCRVIALDGRFCPPDTLRTLCTALPDVAFGVTGVTSPEQLQMLDRAAFFSLATGDPAMLDWCRTRDIPVFLECASCEELESAARLEPDAVMLSFAHGESCADVLRAVHARHPALRVLCREVASKADLDGCLAAPNGLACVMPMEGDAITEDARRWLRRVDGLSLLHVGIYAGDDAETLAEPLRTITRGTLRDVVRNLFVGDTLELMKRDGGPYKGHIAYSTYSVSRICSRLVQEGFELDESSARHDADGTLSFMYLKGEWAGFRIHFVLKPRAEQAEC